MTEQTGLDFTNYAQGRDGSMPTPFTEGVDGVGKTIPLDPNKYINIRIVGSKNPLTGVVQGADQMYHGGYVNIKR